MSAANYDLVIDQGSTFVIDLVVKQSGSVFDLTGYGVRAKMKTSKSATEDAAVFDCSIEDIATGTLKMELDASVSAGLSPGLYVYDLEIHTVDNDIVKRLIEGTVNITAGITVGASG